MKYIGEDSYIDPHAVIRRPHLVTIGRNTNIDYGAYITTGAQIGDYCHIAAYVTCIGGEHGRLIMGNFATIACGSRLVCAGEAHLGEGLVGPTIPKQYQDRQNIESIVFEDFVNIGTNSVILQGVRLGQGSVVGACSLVTQDTEPWMIYKGIPAKPFKTRCKDQMIKFARELGYDY